MMNFTFGMQVNIEVFDKLILSFWVSVTRHVLSTQNKFAYLQESMGDEVDFFSADNR